MEFGEQLASGGEFTKAREAVCNAAWQFIENPEVPAWQRVDLALDMAEYAHDGRAIDLLTGIFTGESELVKEHPLKDHDKIKLIDTLVEYGNPDEVQRAVAVAESIDGSNSYTGSRRGKAFIAIAEQTDGELQKRCIDEALEAASVKPEARDSGRAFTDPERARVFLRAGTLTGDSTLYQKAIDVFTYEEPGDTLHSSQIGFGSLGHELAREITILDGEDQTELREALVSTFLTEFAKQSRPWDSPAGPLLPVLRGNERKQLLQNFTKRGKFILDIAVYRTFLETAKEEGWLGRFRQMRDQAGLKKLEISRQGLHHLDESNTSWELFQLGHQDDETLQRALRNIEQKRAANMSQEDRTDVRSRVVTGLTSGLFSPVQRTAALGYLHELHEVSVGDQNERFRSNLTMMSVEGDTEALAEATQVMLESQPWQQTHLYSEEYPEHGSHVDWRLSSYLQAVKSGEEKELLATGVLLDR